MEEHLLSNINQAIEKGIAYLFQHQYPNGEYCCYMAPDTAMQEWSVPDTTVFPAALIMCSLSILKGNPKVDGMQERSAGFLQYQSMRGGVWNHFTKWHQLFPFCPPDVDNTVYASKALQLLGKEYMDNHALLLANRNSKGLFYTWYALRPNKVWNKTFWMLLLREFKHPVTSFFFWRRNECTRYDIDGVVNANVLFYLGLNEDTKPIIPFLLNIIEQHKEDDCDKWYRNPITFYYFLSRNFNTGIPELDTCKAEVISRILSIAKEDGSIGESALETALSLSVLINSGHQSAVTEHAANYLIRTQTPTGEWARYALFYSGPKREMCWGSEELTTAFCLEALKKYSVYGNL